LGYNETSKDYRIFILAQRKTVVRRNVNFEEKFTSSKSHELPQLTKDKEHEASKGEQYSEDSSSWIQP